MRSALGTAAASILVLSTACGGEPAVLHDGPLPGRALQSDNGLSTNGLSTNGVSSNGLSTNGLSTNGLSTNGLSTNGLSTNGFSGWFTSDPAYSAMVMKYLVRCAYPAGVNLTYSAGGATYTWPGELGLAPTWAGGGAIPVAEQQLVSACLAAHTNKYGAQVSISIRGHLANGASIPVSASEATAYYNDEGCYFGNLFDGTGVFSAYSRNSPLVDTLESSLRACALNAGYYGNCPPMQTTYYSCQSLCTGGFTETTTAFTYTSCRWNGVNYRPLSVRLRDSDIATCGDGICAPSESCSTCAADCGVCHSPAVTVDK
jgi:hypothetical protein